MSRPGPLRELTDRAGAIYADDSGWSLPRHYGDVAAEYNATQTSATLFDVSNRGKLLVAGKDAPTFLHNLCTNDVENLPLGGGCEAFFCNARARVLAHAMIYHVLVGDRQHAFWLDTAPGTAETLRAHLDRHLIAEQVELADRTSEFCQIHLAGPHATAVLVRALADEVPELGPLQHMERTFGVNVHSHVRRNDVLGVPGYDIVCLNSLAPGLWRMIAESGARPAGSDAYDVLRIEAGMPVFGRDIDENRFVVEVGRTSQAISYSKGCYLGQEPIVMARDRAGHAPRLLMGLVIHSNSPVPAGEKVRRNGEEIGVTASSVTSPRLGQPIALAYLRYGHQEPGTVVEIGTGEQTIQAEISTLPFASSH